MPSRLIFKHNHIKDDLKSQEEARNYVLNKELVRPKTTKKVPIIIGVALLVLPIPISIGILCLPIRVASEIWFKILVFVTVYLLFILIGLHPLLINVVKCYQHYASDDVRRMCLCKPTCSEYAISVLKKYPISIALFKIWFRLNRTCTGKTYKIDEP